MGGRRALKIRRILLIALVVCALALPATAGGHRDAVTPAVTTATAATTGDDGREPNPGAASTDVRLHASVDPASGQPDVSVTGACDPLDTKACLLPFPNDLFSVPDTAMDTGRRVQLDVLSMPRNVAGKPIDPSEWNRNDGFSPSTPVLTFVPSLDLHATWGSPLDNIADLSWYARPDAPIVLLDATTGERHPFWSELDQHQGVGDADRLLLLRPAVQLTEGHRYIVAMRNLRRADGSIIDPGPAFAAYRNQAPAPAGADPTFDARRPHMERVMRELGAAGVERDALFLAWDFTIASSRNLTERVLHIRDEAFAALGDSDLTDNVVSGVAPSFAITKVEDSATDATMRHIEGTITVPNYLTPQVEVKSPLPPVELPAEVADALKPLTSALPVGLNDLQSNAFAVPGSRFNQLGSDSSLPSVDPLQPTVDVPFLCDIARGSDVEPSHPVLYGHGLLGSRTEADGGSTQRLRERGFSPCAVDWWGFSFADLPNVAGALVDLSTFPSLIDRSQQGFLNFLLLGRALSNPAGLSSSSAFRTADGRPLLRTNELAYDGNSQGAIMGGALTALAPDLRRSVLGVPGMGYSTLLNRSTDWEDRYAAIYQATYPNPVDQQIGFALIQMLWDRGEASGYAQQMTAHPLPNTPTHDVMLQVAFGDHQVANVTAEIEARTIGASLKVPALAPGQHWSIDPAFGFNTSSGDTPNVGSVLVYWFATDTGLATPPNGNTPARAGTDPHSVPRSYGPAADQVARFLLTGDLIDVCGAAPCVVPRG